MLNKYIFFCVTIIASHSLAHDERVSQQPFVHDQHSNQQNIHDCLHLKQKIDRLRQQHRRNQEIILYKQDLAQSMRTAGIVAGIAYAYGLCVSLSNAYNTVYNKNTNRIDLTKLSGWQIANIAVSALSSFGLSTSGVPSMLQKNFQYDAEQKSVENEQIEKRITSLIAQHRQQHEIDRATITVQAEEQSDVQ